MITIDELKLVTNDFFEKFCRQGVIDGDFTKWSLEWKFQNTLPNNEHKGCYALLNDNRVVYIGLAISNTNNGSGLGSRISNYWKKSSVYSKENNLYDSIVDNVNGIITLPFTVENYYLAAALEIYLITKIPGLKNKAHKRI